MTVAPALTESRPVVLLDPGHFTPYYADALSRALAGLGVQVTVVTSPPQFEAIDTDGRYDVVPAFFPWIASWIGRLLRRRRRGRRFLKAITYPAGVWRTWRLLRHEPPGILHVQWSLIPPLDAALVRRLQRRGWAVVYTIHDLLPEAARGIRSWWHRSMIVDADALIAHTAGLARAITVACPDAPPIHVVAHGRSLLPEPTKAEQHAARAGLGLGTDSQVLLSFGMIQAYKGLDCLIDALPRVLASWPDVRLVIAGEPLMPLGPITRQIARLGVARAVVWRPGFVPEAELSRYFAAADLLVAAHVDQVGVSGVVLTAQACGLPVVASGVGGLPEVVTSEDRGWVVPPRDPEALAEAICRALANPAEMAERAHRARASVARQHDWGDVAQRTTEVYTEAGRHRAPALLPFLKRSN